MSKKSDHATPLLKSLHWLPIKFRIDFKIVLIVFKCLHGLAPTYISELLKPLARSRNLRSSSDKTLLVIPKKKLKTFGDRSFEFYAPKTWNKLPSSVREKNSIESFKRAVKTHYFSEYFY